jgi:hypothetical protein
MNRNATVAPAGLAQTEWISFPGGELEGRRPRVLCPGCREGLRRAVNPQPASEKGGGAETPDPCARPSPSHAPLCFGCYRAELARDKALKAAGQLDTATEARFQSVLPLEPVNHARLVRLRAERDAVREADRTGAGRYVDKRRQAQIAARHALQRIAAGLRMRNAPDAGAAQTASGSTNAGTGSDRQRVNAAGRASAEWGAIHAAELQLPEAWLPFVVSR